MFGVINRHRQTYIDKPRPTYQCTDEHTMTDIKDRPHQNITQKEI